MLSPTLLHLTTTLLLATSALATNPFAQYANDFVDPDYVLSRLDQFASATSGAQDTVRAWADELASHGPWSVTFKPVVAPSGDKHDYMSWAPYQWPDCSKVRNRTELSPAQMRTTCPYVNRDGQVNPDRTIPNDFQSFFNLTDAVLYNSLASTFDSSGGDKAKYAGNAVKFLKTWFIDKDTAMNPNLNFAQMHLGPDGQKGTFTGILDLRMMAKLASGVLLLRRSKAPAWTSDLDSTFVSWCKAYIGWLQTAPTAKQALSAPNNHGTFAAGQMMALQILVGDTAGATSTGRAFFGGAFKGQIAADGDQPLEAKRTRPYHYRNFNAAGLITAARLLKYADPSSNVWNTSSIASGATIQSAVNFVMGVDPSKDQASGDAYDGPDVVKAEIYPNIAAVASTYGDPEGKYLTFLQQSGFPYQQDSFFVWDQPLGGSSAGGSGGGVSSAKGVVSSSSAPSGTTSAVAPAKSNSVGSSKSSGSGSSGTGNASNSNNAGANNNSGSGSGSQQVGSAADTAPGAEKSGLTGAGTGLRPAGVVFLVGVVSMLWTLCVC